MAFAQLFSQSTQWREEELVAARYLLGGSEYPLMEGDLLKGCKALFSKLSELPIPWARELCMEERITLKSVSNTEKNALYSLPPRELENMRSFEGLLTLAIGSIYQQEVSVACSNRFREYAPRDETLIFSSASGDISLQIAQPLSWGELALQIGDVLGAFGFILSQGFQKVSPLFEYRFRVYRLDHSVETPTEIWLGIPDISMQPIAIAHKPLSLLAPRKVTVACQVRLEELSSCSANNIRVSLRYKDKEIAGLIPMNSIQEVTMNDDNAQEVVGVEVNIGALELSLDEFLKLRPGSKISAKLPRLIQGYIPLGDSDRAQVQIELSSDELHIEVIDI